MSPSPASSNGVLVEARLGVHLEEDACRVSERMQSKDFFSWVVMAIRIQREVGGNIAELLNNVSATLREREYLRRQVATLSAEGRLSAWILGRPAPVCRPVPRLDQAQEGYVNPLFTTPIGLAMLGAAVVLLSVRNTWMSKVVKVDV